VTDEDPPDSKDLEAWRQAIGDGRFKNYRLEAIVAAIQDLGPRSDKAVVNSLAKHLSDAVLRILRGLVGMNHPNQGYEIIERTHGHIIDAVLQRLVRRRTARTRNPPAYRGMHASGW